MRGSDRVRGYQAVCNGYQLKTVNGLDDYDPPARWELDVQTGILHLAQCPTGFRMETLTGIENQECQQCPPGWCVRPANLELVCSSPLGEACRSTSGAPRFIAESDNPLIICYVCPESATCPNRGPPLFRHSTVSSVIALQGISEMDQNTINAVAAAIAASLGLDGDQ
eukprot:3298188-Rhodomonas_salina.5